LGDALRITIGTAEENDAMLAALDALDAPLSSLAAPQGAVARPA
jgi:hypothetical protein